MEGDQVGIKKDFMDYLPLLKDVIKGDWENTKKALDNDPTAKTAGLTHYGNTPLHLAVRSGAASVEFIGNLVGMMSGPELEILDQQENTALHCAGVVGHTEAAKILVEKNPGLTQFSGQQGMTPVHCAAAYGHKDTVWFLLTATRHHKPDPLTGQSGVMLLNLLIIAEFYDVAICLLKWYPGLATQAENAIATQAENARFTPLGQLALKPHTFLSGSQLGSLQQLLYDCVSVEKVSASHKEDLENPKYELQEPWKFGFLRHIYDRKLMHLQAVELATATLGIHELVLEIIKAFPDAIWSRDVTIDRYPFQLAVLHRKEKVFNIVHQIGFQKHYVMSHLDKSRNNTLHLAGMLGPSNRISGAALQMQRELQWFKEVEKAVQPSYKEMKNDDGKTPREVFNQQHHELVVKGEEWMKYTASSCTVVAALITTVAFAAAFSLPGGNPSDGLPIYLNSTSFLIFATSNALALFASSASVLVFLGILTSQYSEEDFLRALPVRLCIGLVTLFLSLAFMLAAFSSSLHIVLVHRLNWVAAPIILLACIPLTLFAFLQFPLLVEIVSSTFGPSIFHRQSKEILY